MNIFLFGGSFDPPHLGHQRVIEEVFTAKLADEIWIVPVGDHPFGKKISPALQRQTMVEQMIKAMADPRVKLEQYELQRQQLSFTYQTLEALSQQFPEHHFSWIIGADQLAALSKWHHVEELLAKYRMFVYPRTDVKVDAATLPANVTYLAQLSPVAISSTQIRAAVEQGESIQEWVLPEVERYISENKLYI